MYCENCGHKLNTADLYCEDCGSKVYKVANNQKKSNKTLWIILGCIFGGLFLIGILGIIFFLILIVDYNSMVNNGVEPILEDYYETDYENISNIDSF